MSKVKELISSMQEGAKKEPNQEMINDAYRIARKLMDTKDLLDKVDDSLPDKNKDLKKAIKNLEELDVDVEYLVHRIEKL